MFRETQKIEQLDLFNNLANELGGKSLDIFNNINRWHNVFRK